MNWYLFVIAFACYAFAIKANYMRSLAECDCRVMTSKLNWFHKELDEAIHRTEKEKPFVGNAAKDYYRGQWDALMWAHDELFGEDSYYQKTPGGES